MKRFLSIIALILSATPFCLANEHDSDLANEHDSDLANKYDSDFANEYDSDFANEYDSDLELTVDSSKIIADTLTTQKGSTNALKEWWQSLINGNEDKTFEKKADISFAFAPYYSQESSFGVGGQLSALYRLDRKDSIMQPSDFTLMGGGSINGTYTLGIQGHINWTRSKRMNYVLEFLSQSRDFWGIDFNSCANNPATKVRFNRVNVSADYEQRFAGNWFWGAAVRIKYGAIELDKQEYLQGQSTKGFFSGFGFSLVYDTRDFILNPKKGMLFMFRHIYYPNKLGQNNFDVGYATMQFNAYHPIWKDAILAWDLFAETNITDGVLPWQLREQICYDDRRMRGYYSGSYMDNNQICAQAEIRQHIYKRFGCVAWAGAGTFFKTFESFNNRQILPNYGAGLRFEMKKNTNIRVDFGFGRHASSIIFNFGEAF